MACIAVYDNGLGALVEGSSNVKSVTNAGAGLWDVLFAHTSRTGAEKKFRVQAHLALGSLGACDAAVSAGGIGADTVNVRVNTRNKAGADANLSFNVSLEELG